MNYTIKNMFKIMHALINEGYLYKTKLGVYVDMMIMDVMAQEGVPNNEFELVRSDLFAAAEKGELD